jgi:integrase
MSQEQKLVADYTEVLPELAPAPLKKAATLSNLWGMWIEMKGDLAPRSLEFYRYIASRFLNRFRNDEITVEGLVDWCTHLRTRISPHTGRPLGPAKINEINVRIRGFLRFLKKMGFIRHDLWEFVKLERVPEPKLPVIITDEEYQRLKAHLEKKERYQWMLWLCILGYRTGMSLIDCVHLRCEQVHMVDEGESYMDVPRIKLRRFGDKSICRIPIVPGTDLHEWLLKLAKVARYKRADGMNYVHQDCPGYYAYGHAMMTRDVILQMRQVGLQGRSFATFRRTFISNLVNSGMHYALISKVTAHTNLKTMLRYLNPDRKQLQDGVMKAQQYAEAASTKL